MKVDFRLSFGEHAARSFLTAHLDSAVTNLSSQSSMLFGLLSEPGLHDRDRAQFEALRSHIARLKDLADAAYALRGEIRSSLDR